ncbi:MAG: hypothetical protein LBI64_03880 [Coriobacteriales bacterium]|jgi:serine/threonine protein kinase|nr:hypothetical protein [Coriobacteriales bacterium]
MHVFSQNGSGRCELVEPPIASEGEACIHRIKGQSGVLAKVFKPQSLAPDLESKIRYMITRPPSGSILKHLAWPQELFYHQNGSFAGFSMKEFASGVDINELHPYPPNKYAALDLRYRLTICRNIAITVAGLHASEYVIGDFNPNNIRVNPKTCEVAILDTNSFQFTDHATGHTYPCPVAYDGFVAPELLARVKGLKGGYGELFRKTGSSFTKETDVFALAEHIFLLTMNGTPPFNGLQVGKRLSSVAPGKANDSVERNEYCFKAGYKPLAARTPSLSETHPDIARLFTLAFDKGYGSPSLRPNATDWHEALGRSMKSCRVQCSKDKHHYYFNGLNSCPHCAALKRHKSKASSFIPKPPINLHAPNPAANQATNKTTVATPTAFSGVVARPSLLKSPRSLWRVARQNMQAENPALITDWWERPEAYWGITMGGSLLVAVLSSLYFVPVVRQLFIGIMGKSIADPVATTVYAILSVVACFLLPVVYGLAYAQRPPALRDYGLSGLLTVVAPFASAVVVLLLALVISAAVMIAGIVVILAILIGVLSGG